MEGDLKIVFYDKYCPSCVHYDEDESNPECKCWECLDIPANEDSHKPVNYKEKNVQVDMH